MEISIHVLSDRFRVPKRKWSFFGFRQVILKWFLELRRASSFWSSYFVLATIYHWGGKVFLAEKNCHVMETVTNLLTLWRRKNVVKIFIPKFFHDTFTTTRRQDVFNHTCVTCRETLTQNVEITFSIPIRTCLQGT